ncbi:hypothetical protein [Bradyrhizobium sp. SRL28]|uniref:hypothetical protein n=1 Tax=Bradyrhizobium sp. SRL28 TaxID=2836178 RepID=UPI00201BC90F|nr:hypothetical protein [Bradyrhizobium sp. SRL28]
MARKVRYDAFESRTARLNKFKIRRRPYSGPSLARGILLMYRRNKTNGTWVLKASDGHGGYWTKAVALADDYEDADGKAVLTYDQARDAAKQLARGEDGSADSAPITIDGALKDYKRPGSTQCQRLQRRTSTPPLNRGATSQAGSGVDIEGIEGLARRPARQNGTGYGQSALPLCVRRADVGGAA